MCTLCCFPQSAQATDPSPVSICRKQTHVPDVAKDINYVAEYDNLVVSEVASKVKELAATRELELIACLAGAETGVCFADALSAALPGVLSNGIEPSRRNKSWQQKQVRAAGLRATREASGVSLSDPSVQAFLNSESYPIIVKPTESAGSDGVKRCMDRSDARTHFELLMRAQRRIGSAGAAVICQEFLAGVEYVVDHVSRDGVHKAVMIWRYERAPCNGGDFVLFNMHPVPSDAPEAKMLIDYTRGVLDALGLKHGPSHAEVMLTADGPCLVEMNCRAHGADGTWAELARALTGGVSQVDAAVDSIVDAASFDALSDVYCDWAPFRAAGQLVQLVSKFEGTITSLAPLETVRALPSFQYMQVADIVAPGKELAKTVDLFTGMGFVILCHADAAVVAKDEASIREMQDCGTLVELLDPSSDEEVSDNHEKGMCPDDQLAKINLAEALWQRHQSVRLSEVSQEASEVVALCESSEPLVV